MNLLAEISRDRVQTMDQVLRLVSSFAQELESAIPVALMASLPFVELIGNIVHMVLKSDLRNRLVTDNSSHYDPDSEDSSRRSILEWAVLLATNVSICSVSLKMTGWAFSDWRFLVKHQVESVPLVSRM